MILILLFFIILGSSEVMPALDCVDTIIESEPDSAYKMLLGMDRSTMTKRELARFSVLYSMAMDKQYIDVASDSIICNAVDYYSHHGDPDYKMRTFYYQGIVKQNAGDIDGAMESFVKAEHYGRKSDNNRMKGRVYMGLMDLHRKLFDIQRALEESQKAADCFLDACDSSRYINARLEECSLLNSLLDFAAAKSALDELSCLFPNMTSYQKNRYNVIFVNNALFSGSCTSNQISTVLESISDGTSISWITVARLYLEAGNYESASSAIAEFELVDSEYYQSPLYHLIKSRIAAANGEMSKAYSCLNDYVTVKDSIDLSVMNSSAPFAEERYIAEIKEFRRRWQIASLLLISLIVYLISENAIKRVKRHLHLEYEKTAALELENKHLETVAAAYATDFEQAQVEISRLKRLRNGAKMSKEIVKLVDERLDILNKYVAGQISGNGFIDGGSVQLSSLLADQCKFFDSMRASFTLAHPNFISHLKGLELTDKEIGCCCLYCIGLRGAEIASYLGMTESSYYNYSSKIRKKLGLNSYSTNIDAVLNKMMNDLDARL